MKKKKDRILIFATDFRLICETGYFDIRFGRIPKYSMRSAKSGNWPDYPVGQISSPFISNRALTMFIIVKILCYINYIMYCLCMKKISFCRVILFLAIFKPIPLMLNINFLI